MHAKYLHMCGYERQSLPHIRDTFGVVPKLISKLHYAKLHAAQFNTSRCAHRTPVGTLPLTEIRRGMTALCVGTVACALACLPCT